MSKKISEERIKNEIEWLRCIDMDDDDNVRRAAIEIIGAIENRKENLR